MKFGKQPAHQGIHRLQGHVPPVCAALGGNSLTETAGAIEPAAAAWFRSLSFEEVTSKENDGDIRHVPDVAVAVLPLAPKS